MSPKYFKLWGMPHARRGMAPVFKSARRRLCRVPLPQIKRPQIDRTKLTVLALGYLEFESIADRWKVDARFLEFGDVRKDRTIFIGAAADCDKAKAAIGEVSN